MTRTDSLRKVMKVIRETEPEVVRNVTIRDIMDGADLTSTSHTSDLLDALENLGMIKRVRDEYGRCKPGLIVLVEDKKNSRPDGRDGIAMARAELPSTR